MDKVKGPVLDIDGNEVAFGDRVKRLRRGSNGKTYSLRCTVTGFIPASGWLLVSLRADGVLSNPYSERAEFDEDHYVCSTIKLVPAALQHAQKQVGR